MIHNRSCCSVPAVLLLAALTIGDPTDAAVEFERDIRPLLAERCVSCHGEKKQKAQLRLDRRADAMKGGENGPVIVAGKPGESALLKAVTSADADQIMPPKGDRLTEKEV